MTGAEFDRNYIDAMVSGHRDALKLYEQEITLSPSRPQSASKPNEAEVVRVAKEQLPTIKHHLTEAEKIQKTLSPSQTVLK
jgi:predicted outer membrane protein